MKRNLSFLLASLFVIAGAIFATGARAEGEILRSPMLTTKSARSSR
jgi:hypothetical protein